MEKPLERSIEFILEEIKKGGAHSIIFYPKPVDKIKELLKIIEDKLKYNSIIIKIYLKEGNIHNEDLYSLEFEKEHISYLSYDSDEELEKTKIYLEENLPHYIRWVPVDIKKQLYSNIWE